MGRWIIEGLPIAFLWLLAADILLLLPMAFWKRTQSWAMAGFGLSAAAFTGITWLSSAILLAATWGLGVAVIATVAVPGVGTVLAAIVAALIVGHGHIWGLLGMIAATVGSVSAGMVFSARGQSNIAPMPPADRPRYNCWTIRNRDVFEEESSTSEVAKPEQ